MVYNERIKVKKGEIMIKFDLEFDGLHECYHVMDLLYKLEKDINEEELIMKETTFNVEEYEITMLYGYEELELCTVRRLK
jgi:hypothetical protein